MDEEWRDIAEYEGYYQVSNLGRVRSVDRVVIHQKGIGNRNGMTRRIKGKLLSPKPANGYLRVILSKDGVIKNMLIHRLVAEAFIEPIDGKEFVDHVNADRTDNRAENLRWVTSSENTRHSYELGRHDIEAMRKRNRERVAKFGTATPPKPVIRSDGVVFESISAAARALGTSQGNLSRALAGKRHSCKGYSFKFVEQAS